MNGWLILLGGFLLLQWVQSPETPAPAPVLQQPTDRDSPIEDGPPAGWLGAGGSGGGGSLTRGAGLTDQLSIPFDRFHPVIWTGYESRPAPFYPYQT